MLGVGKETSGDSKEIKELNDEKNLFTHRRKGLDTPDNVLLIQTKVSELLEPSLCMYNNIISQSKELLTKLFLKLENIYSSLSLKEKLHSNSEIKVFYFKLYLFLFHTF